MSLNKVMIIGYLGRDPELRYMPSGQSVANLSIATEKKWKDLKSGERRSHTEWHKVVLFNRHSEIAAQFLHKGAQVFIEGYLQTKKWTDKTNATRYTTEIIGTSMQFMNDKNERAYEANDEMLESSLAQMTQEVPQTSPERANTQPKTGLSAPIEDEEMDDIPF